MAEISLECLKTLMHMGIALGHAANVMDDLQKEEGLPGYYSDFLIPPDKLLDTLIEEAGSVLDDCPHPPNAASDNAPPRKFTREIRELKRNWRDQPKDATITQMDNLQVILNDWVAGITGATPSASFYGGGVPGTMPTGEPTWMADPYQVDTSGQFLRKYPSAWRDKKARTRVTSQKRIGAKL